MMLVNRQDAGKTPPTSTTATVVERPPMLHAQKAASEAAWTPEAYAAAERNAAIREAVQLLVDGRPGKAHAVVMRSFLRQLRIHGLGYAAIPGRDYEEMGRLP